MISKKPGSAHEFDAQHGKCGFILLPYVHGSVDNEHIKRRFAFRVNRCSFEFAGPESDWIRKLSCNKRINTQFWIRL